MRKSLFRFSNLTNFPKLVHGIGPRAFGDVTKDRAPFVEALGFPRWPMVEAFQTHGDRVYVHRQGDLVPVCAVDDYDAFVSDAPGIGFLIKVADCQPVLLYEPRAHVVGLAHSGWRGSVKNVVGKTVRAMVDSFGVRASEIWAGLGPSIGPCCAEFSNPEQELAGMEGVGALEHYLKPGRRVDFWNATLEQLGREGVPREQIECAGICTVCHKEEWFSHRGDGGETGRFGAVIGLV